MENARAARIFRASGGVSLAVWKLVLPLLRLEEKVKDGTTRNIPSSTVLADVGCYGELFLRLDDKSSILW